MAPQSNKQILREAKQRLMLITRGFHRWYTKRYEVFEGDLSVILVHNHAIGRLQYYGWSFLDFRGTHRADTKLIIASKATIILSTIVEVREVLQDIVVCNPQPDVVRACERLKKPLGTLDGMVRLLVSTE